MVTPYVDLLRLFGGGVCAQACLFMATAMLKIAGGGALWYPRYLLRCASCASPCIYGWAEPAPRGVQFVKILRLTDSAGPKGRKEVFGR